MVSEEILDGRDLGSYIKSIIRADAKGYTTATEFIQRNRYFFEHVRSSALDAPAYDPRGPNQKLKHTTALNQLIIATKKIETIGPETWTVEGIKSIIKNIISETWEDVDKDTRRMNNRALFHYLRWAIAGGNEGASIADAMVILGQEITIDRLRNAAALCAAKTKLDEVVEAQVILFEAQVKFVEAQIKLVEAQVEQVEIAAGKPSMSNRSSYN